MKNENLLKGILWMILSSLSFAMVGAMLRIAGDVPVYEKVFFRNIITLAFAIFLLWKNRVKPFTRETNYKLLIARSLCGLAGVFLYFYSIEHLSLGDAATINKLSPFFVMLFASIFLHEKMYPFMIISVIAAFVGCAFVVKPSLHVLNVPALAAIVGSLFAGAAYTLIRAMSGKEHPAKIVFYFSFVSTIATIPLVVNEFVIPSPRELLGLLGVGIFAALGQIALTHSYHNGKATEVAIYKYSHMLFAFMIGIFFFKEIADIYSIIGAVIIVLAALWNNRALRRKKATVKH